MYSRYLITGASGFLGRAVIEELVRRSARIDALVLPDDPCAALLPKEAHTVIGDVCEEDSLARFPGSIRSTSAAPARSSGNAWSIRSEN